MRGVLNANKIVPVKRQRQPLFSKPVDGRHSAFHLARNLEG